MRIRAAVLERFAEPLVVQDVELADPKAGEVLVPRPSQDHSRPGTVGVALTRKRP